MRLKKYINENKHTLNIFSVSDVISVLYDKCQPFIKDITSPKYGAGGLLYSGRRGTENIFISDVRKNRKPTDTKINVHNDLDTLFKKKFGWKARSNSIFCTGSAEDAADYGNTVYMIFPIGKYRYLWSDKIDDLFFYVDTHLITSDPNRIDRLAKTVNKYKTSDIKKAISSKHEIMVNCDQYLAIHTNYELSIEKAFRSFGARKPTDKELKTME